MYKKASSAKLDWGKFEGFIIRQWRKGGPLVLPGSLQWRTAGMKCLGVYLGFKRYQVVKMDLGPASAVL